MTKPLTPQQLRDAELPRARRGFEEGATRELLADAAGALSAVTSERDDLQKRVEELSKQAAQHPTDAETIGAVLMTAHRAGEDLLAKAAEEAAQMRASAESERDDLFVRAQAHAESMVAEAAATIESLRHEDEALRHSNSVYRRELMLFLKAALSQLEEVESFGPGTAQPMQLDGELLAQLPSQ